MKLNNRELEVAYLALQNCHPSDKQTMDAVVKLIDKISKYARKHKL